MANFNGKVALITGASSGIGAGTAVHFAALGCKLSLSGRDEGNLVKVAEDCIKAGAKSADILKIKGDLLLEEDVKTILETTINHFGKLDILVNNAGTLATGSIETFSLERYDEIMRVNVRSVLQLTQLAIPHLRKTKGNIVNVSSIGGIRPIPNVGVYCISKAAVDQLTRCTALEVAKDGIRVNAVNPGAVVTQIQKRSGLSGEDMTGYIERCKETHALGRAGEVHEVARAIAFLADNNASSFTTGDTLLVDGGRGLMCPR